MFEYLSMEGKKAFAFQRLCLRHTDRLRVDNTPWMNDLPSRQWRGLPD